MFDFLKNSYKKVKEALSKSASSFAQRLHTILGGKIDEEKLEALEALLYEANLGATLAGELVDKLRKQLTKKPDTTQEELLHLLEQELSRHLLPAAPLDFSEPPLVILITGVNGSGKTTSIAKMAQMLQKAGKKVIIAAGDTFRAAATEQLSLWAERLGIEIIRGQPRQDPSALVFDALHAAIARKADVLLIDTAGRLQAKTELMRELAKIRKTCEKVIPGAPHETFLVLDANSGQNGVDQAHVFHQFTPLTGLIITKLDGTSKAGVAIALQSAVKLPIQWIGVGEGVDDLIPFDPESFLKGLLGL